MMLIEKLGKELLSGGFGGGVGGSPDFLAAPLKANPISRIPFVDSRHVRHLLRGEYRTEWHFCKQN
jgi:hypothetical protein